MLRSVLLLFVLFHLPLGVAAEQAVPALTGRVIDQTKTLSSNQREHIEGLSRSFEEHSGSQIAVLLVASTQPETIEQYAIRVAEQWKLGRKGIDDGVLILIAKQDRAARIEVGYGLEGRIPDVTAKRIIEDQMIPSFKAGNFYQGILNTVQTLIASITNEALPPPKRKAPSTPLNWSFILLVLFIIFWSFLSSYGNRRYLGRSYRRFGSPWYSGGFGGGGFRSGGFGGFSGGGGGFGGGGASGRW